MTVCETCHKPEVKHGPEHEFKRDRARKDFRPGIVFDEFSTRSLVLFPDGDHIVALALGGRPAVECTQVAGV